MNNWTCNLVKPRYGWSRYSDIINCYTFTFGGQTSKKGGVFLKQAAVSNGNMIQKNMCGACRPRCDVNVL